MKAITKYQAYDGTEFADEFHCDKHERFSRHVDAVVARLPKLPEGTDFANGGGYIQHDPEVFWDVREQLLLLAKEEFDHKWIQDSLDRRAVHPSFAGRIISESGCRALWKAWTRISCTDDQLREWGQPYYRDHSSEAEQFCINTHTQPAAQ